MSTDDDPTPEDEPSLENTATASEGHAAVAGFESTDAPLEPFGEVLSEAMDPHDPDATGELDLPGLNEKLGLIRPTSMSLFGRLFGRIQT